MLNVPFMGICTFWELTLLLLKSLEEYSGAVRGNFVTFSAWTKERESYTGDRNNVFY